MARRKWNPDDARKLHRDIDELVQGSGSTIDAAYDEYKTSERQLQHLEEVLEQIEKEHRYYVDKGGAIPSRIADARGETKRLIREEKDVIRGLSKRIAAYANANLKRIRERLELIEASPGASTQQNKRQIKEVHRAIFKLKNKAKLPFTDLRRDFAAIWGMIVTIEQDLGMRLRPAAGEPGKKMSKRRRDIDAASEMLKRWTQVRKYAKKHPGTQDEVEFIDQQFRTLHDRARRGEDIRSRLDRLQERIKDLHLLTQPRAHLPTYAEAKRGVESFVEAIKEYSQREMTPAGVDRMKFELEKFARGFKSEAKAQWSKVQQREFATDVRRLYKALERLKSQAGRKKNPCVGLHFHGKDADDLLKAMEEASKRIDRSPQLRKLAKENPNGAFGSRAKRLSASRLRAEHKELSALLKSSADPITDFGSEGLSLLKMQIRTLAAEMKRRKLKPNPAGKKASKKKKNPDARGSDFSEAIIECQDRTIPKTPAAIDKKIASCQKVLKDLRAQQKRATKTRRYDVVDVIEQSSIDMHDFIVELYAAKRQKNPGKKKAKKASKKAANKKATRKTSPSQSLINRCRKLWDVYCEKPTKKNLRAVQTHLDKMQDSTAKSVKDERKRCLRAANAEAKRLGMK